MSVVVGVNAPVEKPKTDEKPVKKDKDKKSEKK